MAQNLPPPPAEPAGVGEPFPVCTPESTDRRPAHGRRRLVLLWAMLVLLAAGLVGFLVLQGGGAPMPPTIDGVPQLTTERARAAADTMERMTSSLGGKGRMATYGHGTTVSLLVMVYEEPAAVTFDQEFRGFSYSFMGTSGATLDPASELEETSGGVHYRCQTDPVRSVSVCVMGGDRRFVGLAVMDSGGSESALALAKTVQAATADVSL